MSKQLNTNRNEDKTVDLPDQVTMIRISQEIEKLSQSMKQLEAKVNHMIQDHQVSSDLS